MAHCNPPRAGLGPGSERARSTGRIGGRPSTRLTTRSADERGTGLFVFGGAVVVGALNALCEGGLIHNERRSVRAGLWRDRAEAGKATAARVHWCDSARPRLALGGAVLKQAQSQHAATRRKAAYNHKTQGLAGRRKRVRGRVVMEGSVASCCGAAGSDVVRSWRGEDPHWDRQPYNYGRRQCIWGRQRCVWGRHRVIGVGNSALGQVNYLPQCGLTCPNAANVPQCDSRRPGGRGARATGSVFTAMPPVSQRYHALQAL